MPAPRETFLLVRGQYDKKGEKVVAGVPASLAPLPASAPHNRLGLAQWLVDPANPLTARVIVNRYWQMYFGTGLVKNFAFAMNIGVIVGTYSSIFLAVPIFMWISSKWYSGPPKRRRGVPAAAEPTP